MGIGLAPILGGGNGTQDTAFVLAVERALRESGASPDAFFFRHRGGRALDDAGPLAEALAGRAPAEGALDHPLWQEGEPPSLVIDTVEQTWAAIDRDDDWAPFHALVARIRRLGDALGRIDIQDSQEA